jgi:hypothetical protein
MYMGTLSNKLASRESNWFVWEGFRTGITAGYRFNTRLLKWVLIIILVMIKQWQTTNRLISYDPATSPAATYVSFTAKGQIIAFDLVRFGFVFRRTCRF